MLPHMSGAEEKHDMEGHGEPYKFPPVWMQSAPVLKIKDDRSPVSRKEGLLFNNTDRASGNENLCNMRRRKERKVVFHEEGFVSFYMYEGTGKGGKPGLRIAM